MGHSRCWVLSADGGQSFRKAADASTGKFINLSAAISGSSLLLFGTDIHYRFSNPYLARTDLSQAAQIPNSLSYFSGLDSNTGAPTWSPSEATAAPLLDGACLGELSVTWNPFLQQWLMLYNCGNPAQILLRSSPQPWGPWSSPQVVFDPTANGGFCHFMHQTLPAACDHVSDPGRENRLGDAYAPYVISRYTRGDAAAGTSTLYFVMSTWNPYNTVVMKVDLTSASPFWWLRRVNYSLLSRQNLRFFTDLGVAERVGLW